MSFYGPPESARTQPLPPMGPWAPRNGGGPPTAPVWSPPPTWYGPGWQPPVPPPGPPRRSGLLVGLAALVSVVVLLAAVGVGLALRPSRPSPAGSPGPAAAGGPATAPASSPAASPTAAPSPPPAVPLTAAAIAAAVEPGVVDINANLGSQGSAAGTGMVLTGTGEVLTNNHVIAGAVSLRIEVAGSGHAYRGTVVGRDVADDIAVVQMQGATGLRVIPVGDSATVRVGDAVLAMGNALGLAGPPSRAPGTVVGLNRSITASDPSAGTSENLVGLIQTDARLQPGDSGGPLANDLGQVIGMDTAASERVRFTAGGGFAIPINRALQVAATLYSGKGGTTAPALVPGILGVSVGSAFAPDGTPDGAAVVGLSAGSPAQSAGIRPGDLIVSIDGSPVDSPDTLTGLLQQHNAGDSVRVGWVTTGGVTRSATVRLAPKPAG